MLSTFNNEKGLEIILNYAFKEVPKVKATTKKRINQIIAATLDEEGVKEESFELIKFLSKNPQIRNKILQSHFLNPEKTNYDKLSLLKDIIPYKYFKKKFQEYEDEYQEVRSIYDEFFGNQRYLLIINPGKPSEDVGRIVKLGRFNIKNLGEINGYEDLKIILNGKVIDIESDDITKTYKSRRASTILGAPKPVRDFYKEIKTDIYQNTKQKLCMLISVAATSLFYERFEEYMTIPGFSQETPYVVNGTNWTETLIKFEDSGNRLTPKINEYLSQIKNSMQLFEEFGGIYNSDHTEIKIQTKLLNKLKKENNDHLNSEQRKRDLENYSRMKKEEPTPFFYYTK